MESISAGAPKTQDIPSSLPSPAVQEGAEEAKSLGKKVFDYFESRPTTGGDLEFSSPMRAAGGGALQGFFVGGPNAAAGGAAGGFIGTRIGEELHSMKHAIAASAISGAGSTLLITSLLPFVIGNPSAIGTYIAAMGLTGGAAGAAGSLIGVLGNERHRDAIKEGVHKLFSRQEERDAKTEEPEGQKVSLFSKALTTIGEVLKPITDRIPPKLLAALTGAGLGAAAGAIGGPVGMAVSAATGAAAGVAGSALAENMSSVKEQGTTKALLKGVGLGTAFTASASALAGAGAITAITGNPGLGLALLGCSLIGALSGTAGALSGSRLASVRDGSTGGFIGGYLANSFLGNKGALMLTPLAASVGGAVGARGKNKLMKVLLSALSGGAIGAATGLIGGPISAAVGAVIGAGASVLGALGGPKLQQGIRNFSEDIRKKVSHTADSVTGKLIDKLGVDKGIAAAGFLSGAVGSLPLAIMGGLVFGPAGALIPTAVSGALGAYRLRESVKDVDSMGMLQKQFKEHGPSLEDLTDRMTAMATPSLVEQMKDLPPDEQEKHLIAFAQSTYKELKNIEPLIDRIGGALCTELYKEGYKKGMKHCKTDEEKAKFLEDRISADKAQLANIVVSQVIAIMSAREKSATSPAPAAS
jgi:hypothetical protein